MDSVSDPGFLRATEEIPAFTFVALDTSGPKLGKKATASDDVLGITQGLTPSGSAIKMITNQGDVARCVAGASISLGDKVGPDADGKGITAATSGKVIGGTALEAAGAADEVIFILVEKNVLP